MSAFIKPDLFFILIAILGALCSVMGLITSLELGSQPKQGSSQKKTKNLESEESFFSHFEDIPHPAAEQSEVENEKVTASSKSSQLAELMEEEKKQSEHP